MYYLINNVTPRFYVFCEEDTPLYERIGVTPHVISMQLVIGSERAVLIDTGFGKGDLAALVRQYTDLPVSLLITHGDFDHYGGYPMFEDRYMSSLDDELLEKDGNAFSHRDLADGEIFDLGGVELEAIHVAGHTRGSFCFYDRKHGRLFTGDSVNRLPWLLLDRCTPLHEYRDNLIALRRRLDGEPEIYCGHSYCPFPFRTLTDTIVACNEVLEGVKEREYPYFMPFEPGCPILPDAFEHQVNEVRLIYSRNNL